MYLDRKPGDGLGVIEHVNFTEGIVEIDLLGENNPGKSFVGFAFNIQNDSTYEAVYFRPFNFHSEEEIRRSHSMQYIFHPENTWRKLRTEQEGKFEATFINPPNPDDWFSVRLNITENTVTVYDADNNRQLMTVPRLTFTQSPRIGLWAGFNSKGGYRNLKIKPGSSR